MLLVETFIAKPTKEQSETRVLWRKRPRDHRDLRGFVIDGTKHRFSPQQSETALAGRRRRSAPRCGRLGAVKLPPPAARHYSLYEAVLGEGFASLHAHVRRAHLPPLRAEGTIDVEHGPGWLARPAIWLMKLPAAGPGQPVRLEVAEDGPELVWTRRIGGSILETRQCASGSRLVERSGLGRVSFDLAVEDGALLYRQSSIHVAGLPVSSSIGPRVDGVVAATADGWRVVVTVTWRGRLVCRYAGKIRAS
jgi:hypothetical protein